MQVIRVIKSQSCARSEPATGLFHIKALRRPLRRIPGVGHQGRLNGSDAPHAARQEILGAVQRPSSEGDLSDPPAFLGPSLVVYLCGVRATSTHF